MKTTPSSMPDDGTRFTDSKPWRMVSGEVGDPESPGFRRGLFVSFARVKPSARLENAQHQNSRRGLLVPFARRHASATGASAPWPRMNFRVPAGPSKSTVPTARGPVPLMPAITPSPYSACRTRCPTW